MTELRDARLRRALDEAPDAQLRPLPRTREAVLAAAHAAARPWWRRFWAPAGESRMPWNAALATVLVAGFIAVLWQGQEVPTAQPEAKADRASTEAPSVKKEAAVAQVKPGAVVAEQAPAAAAAPVAPAKAPAPQPQRAPATAVRPAEPERNLRAREDAPGTLAKDPAPQQGPEPTPAAPEKQAARAEREAPPVQDQAVAPFAGAAAGRSAPAAPAAPAAAQAPAAGIRGARQPAESNDTAAAPMERRAASQSAAVARWTQLRLEGAGKVVDVTRNEAGGLARDIERLASSPVSGSFTDEAALRVRLLDGARLVGTLVLGRTQAGWLPGEEAGAAGALAADPLLVQAVRSDVARRLN